VISAGEVDPTGRVLYRVFVSQREENGAESVFTARVGVVVPEQEGKVVRLRLKEGRGLVAGGWLEFDDLNLARGITIDQNPFRPRGGSERELTFSEMRGWGEGSDGLPAVHLDPAADLYGSVLFQGGRFQRLRRYHRAAARDVDADVVADKVDPVWSLWSVGAIYILGSGWLYLATSGQGSNSPMRVLLRWFDLLMGDAIVKGRRLFARWSGAE